MALKEFAGAAAATRLAGSLASGTTTSFAVLTGGGSTYPNGATAPFVVVIDRATSLEEKILVATRSGDTFTGLTRGYDGTSAQAHSAQATVEHVIDAATLTEVNAHVNTTTRDDHTQYLNTARHNADSHAFGAELGTPGTPTTSAPGDAAGAGTGVAASREDHRHGREAFATPTRLAFANAAGSAATLPRSDHVHQRELIPCLRLRRAGAGQNCPSDTNTTIIWDTEDKDTDNQWSSGSTITFNKAGAYMITVQFDSAGSVSGYLQAYFVPSVGTNQPRFWALKPQNFGISEHWGFSFAFDAAAGETMTLGIAHSNAGAASILVNASLNVVWMGPTA